MSAEDPAGGERHDDQRAIGIDVGGTKVAVALVRGRTVLEEAAFETPQTGVDDIVERIVGTVGRLDEAVGTRAIGVCAPGLLDVPSGRIRFATNVRGLSGSKLGALLATRLGAEVHVENDANAAAYAEYRFGAGAGLERMFYLTVSTGIGGGFVADGGVMRGAHGFAADVGHMSLSADGPVCSCGERGCLEAFASGTAIAREGERVLGFPISPHEVFARARGGEVDAAAVVERASDALARGLANVAKILDPDGIVLGGGVAMEGEFFLAIVRQHLDRYLANYHPVPLRQAKLGRLAGAIGAAALAHDARLAVRS